MNTLQKDCPFKVGDVVVYRPSERGLGYEVMDDKRLIPGKEYVISEIQKGLYVVVPEYKDNPRGGIYWTEFEKDVRPE
ncbi:MAG TPA: hypothetical protein VK302_19565 [Terriglobales bacterium]|nr:hypothetical protein [Terriglobales bacterium]